MKKLTVTFFQTREGQWYWHLKSANGKIIATGGEGYKRLHGARKAFAVLQDFVEHAKIVIEKKDGKKVVEFDPDNSP